MEESSERNNAHGNTYVPPGDRKYPRNNQQRPVGDLRDHLIRKRQQHTEGGPPPDPRYSFLSDPSRENDYDPNAHLDDTENSRNPQEGSSVTYETKNYRRGRGEYYGQYRGNNFRPRSRGRGRGRGRGNDNWQHERYNIDQERINRQRSNEGGWQREWDAGKADTWKEVPGTSNRSRNNRLVYEDTDEPQYQNKGQKHEYFEHQKKINSRSRYSENAHQAEDDGNNLENAQGTSKDRFESPTNYRSERDNTYHRGSYYRGRSSSPRRYENQRFNSPRRFNTKKNFKHLDPVNIKVEFDAVTGEHKYSVDKIEVQKKRGGNYRGRTRRAPSRKNEPKTDNAEEEDEQINVEKKPTEVNDDKVPEDLDTQNDEQLSDDNNLQYNDDELSNEEQEEEKEENNDAGKQNKIDLIPEDKQSVSEELKSKEAEKKIVDLNPVSSDPEKSSEEQDVKQ